MPGKQERSGSSEDHGFQEVVIPSGHVQEESSEDLVRIYMEERDGLNDYSKLEEIYKDRTPKNWDELTYNQRLEWFAHRMLLDHRENIRQESGNEAAREWGFLSDYQIERRRRREVQSKIENWEDVPPTDRVFSRVYVDPNTLRTGRSPEDYDGQKNKRVQGPSQDDTNDTGSAQ